MTIRTRVGNAGLFLTRFPERDDILVEEFQDGDRPVYLVVGMYVVADNALQMFRDDIEAAQLNWKDDVDWEFPK